MIAGLRPVMGMPEDCWSTPEPFFTSCGVYESTEKFLDFHRTQNMDLIYQIHGYMGHYFAFGWPGICESHGFQEGLDLASDRRSS